MIPMDIAHRESEVLEAFRLLSDTLVSDADVPDQAAVLAWCCVELLDVTAAGVILTDGTPAGTSVAAASTVRARLLEEFAIAIDEGPGPECVRTGEPIGGADLTGTDARRRWPRFVAGAAEAGFGAAHTVPMRLRGEVIGGVSLWHADPHILPASDALLGRALADVATIGLLNRRAVHRAEAVTLELQGALDSRVVIEQAKGVLATQGGLSSPEDAFLILCSYARSHGRRITDLARDVVDRTVDLTSIVRPAV